MCDSWSQQFLNLPWYLRRFANATIFSCTSTRFDWSTGRSIHRRRQTLPSCDNGHSALDNPAITLRGDSLEPDHNDFFDFSEIADQPFSGTGGRCSRGGKRIRHSGQLALHHRYRIFMDLHAGDRVHDRHLAHISYKKYGETN